MSYDLYLFEPQPGLEAKHVIEELLSRSEGLVLRKMLASKDPAAQRQEARGQKNESEADAQARILQLAQLLEASDPSLVRQANTSERTVKRIVLLQPEKRIHYLLESSHVAVTVPFSHPPETAEALFQSLSQGLTALQKAGGFQLYDPQLGRVAELPADLDAIITAYCRLADTTMNPVAPKPAPKPWWKKLW